MNKGAECRKCMDYGGEPGLVTGTSVGLEGALGLANVRNQMMSREYVVAMIPL